jgi:probable F420-dependent oxidoreductase
MKIDAMLMTPPEGAAAMAQRFESEGFGAAWSFEGPHDPFFPLVLAAPETQHIELGTAIAVAFARNPMVCAYMAQDLQTLTQGRFILGLGTQIKPHIEKRFSETWSRPAARMHEFVQAIRAIWRGFRGDERLDFRGEFYTHTLMTPVFSPGKNLYGDPRIFLAAVGPKMAEVTGEVADGFIVHPFHSKAFMQAETLPALARGLSRSGRSPGDCVVSCQTIVALGNSDEEIEKARAQARAQLAFYASTPAYRGVLELFGTPELQGELNRMSKEGKWEEMAGRIGDDLFDTLAVSGKPSEVADQLRKRNTFANRTTLMLYNESEPEAPADIVRQLAG